MGDDKKDEHQSIEPVKNTTIEKINIMAENCDIKFPIYRGPLYDCNYCHMMFISEVFLRKHQKKCINMKIYSLLKKKLNFKKIKIKRERNDETSERNSDDYFCEECFSGFLDLTEYNKHLYENHRNQYPNDIVGCSQQLQQSFHLLNPHITLREQQMPINPMSQIPLSQIAQIPINPINSFNLCPPSFSDQTNNQTKFKNEEKPYSCPQCPSKLMYRENLKRHLLIHTGEKPYACPHCPIRFLRSADLKRHLLNHSGYKPFACTICPSRFTQSSDLKKHYLIHTGDKPFSCPQCDSKFSHHYSLKKHLLIHTGEKPYACTHCTSKFNQISALKRHLLIHSGERPFQCPHCPSRFIQSSNLKYHLLTHSGEKPYACNQCNSRFTRKASLDIHIVRKHVNKKGII